MTEIQVTACVGVDPRFAGSIHDDSSAKVYGYQGALVPGPLVYGYMSRIPVELWGKAWLERGTMASRNRRPAYDGQAVTITASDVAEDATGKRITLVTRDGQGNELATGEATLPHAPATPPSLGDYTVWPVPEHPPAVKPGAMPVGAPLCSDLIAFTAELQRTSLADFGDVWPGYLGEGLVHAGYLMRRAVRDGVLSFTYPTPGIFVSGWTQHFALAHVGDKLATAGRVTANYERKGQHYFDTEQVMIANGARIVAMFRRSSIYAARRAVAA
jgi:hypothetical protein